MGRLWSCGFELASTTNGVEFSNGASASVQSTTVRSGTYAQQVTSLSSGAARGISSSYSVSSTTGPIYARFYYCIGTLPSASNRIMNFATNSVVGTSTRPGVRLSSTGTLQLMNNDAQVGSDSSALTLDTWYRVELMYDGTPASGSRIVELRLDGNTVASTNTATNTLSANFVCFGGNLASEAQTTGNWYYDDIAVNDTSGAAQTSWPGEGKIVHLKPNSSGDNSMGTRGGADSGSDYGQLDEATPNDATDYYVLDANNDIIDVGLEDSGTAGIAASDAITLVHVGIRERAEIGLQESWQLRIKSCAGGTVTSSATITHNDATWRTNGDELQFYQLASYTDPTTGVAWTATGTNSLDNMQIGVQAIDADPDIWISTLWAVVEYVPDAGGGGGGGSSAALLGMILMMGIIPFRTAVAALTSGTAMAQHFFTVITKD